MKGRADTILLAAVAGLFAIVLLLHVSEVLRGRLAWIPVRVVAAAGPDLGPRVHGFWTDASADAPGLRVGDEILRVGDTVLSGAGPLAFVAAVYQTAAGALEVPVTFRRGGGEGDASISLVPVLWPWRKTLFAVTFVLVGGLAFWRAESRPLARLFLLCSFAYALNWCDFWGRAQAQTYAAVFAFAGGTALTAPILLRLLLSFPPEVGRHGPLARWAPWALLPVGLGASTWAFGWPLPPALGQPFAVAGSAVVGALAIAILTQNYWRASRVGRRQVRWVLLGLWLGLGPMLLAAAVVMARPHIWWVYEASLMATIAIPICVFIAIVRFNLFDIDRLVTAAATYTLLSITFLAVVLGASSAVAQALDDVLEPAVAQSVTPLLLAAVVLAVQRPLREALERRLFPERQALRDDALHLRRSLSRCDKPEEVISRLGSGLREALRCESTVIYGRAGESFAPVYARGRAIAPAFSAEGSLIAQLELRREPVDLTSFGAHAGHPATDYERATLDAMGAELLLPLGRGDELAAFVCLGGKQSGDVFTGTDRALLQGVVEKAADELVRFGDAEVLAQQEEMNRRLRSYVPGAIVEQLDQGGELAEGEAEVTVLFVDIRGYTSFSESRAPSAIFSAINHYTEAVSRIVRAHGGTVVEFNGDGMMTVFGAPASLAKKERAAVNAAREIVSAVSELELEGGSRVDAGIGVATGPAYVGSVRAVDRHIWTALGNTTNLAARLQSLTRDLDASIAIDGPTHAAAHEAAKDFQAHLSRRVRGRSTPIDIHALPLQDEPARGGES